jgi:hypothetical protein
MAEELVCGTHGPYSASLNICPICARERGELPSAPASLHGNDMDYTQGPAATPGYSDDDETILPGQQGKRGSAVTSGRGGNDADETIPPAQRSGGAAWDDDEKTQPPISKSKKRRILEDDGDDDDVDRTRIKAKEQTGLMGWLIVKKSPYFRRGHTIKITSGNIFGRGREKADEIIDDDYVSKEHARIRIKDEKFILYDLGSENGTLVNDVEITGATEINQDDEITIGNTVFVLKTLK